MTDGYDIITEISSTYNSEHSEVAQAFWPCKHLDTTLSSAAEIFQNTLSNAREGLVGVRNISDDIIVFGRNQEKHDKRL
jgi:hypothetical protein